MSEATLILKNMRGGCATVDGAVHTLFRFSTRRSGDATPSGRDEIREAVLRGLSDLRADAGVAPADMNR